MALNLAHVLDLAFCGLSLFGPIITIIFVRRWWLSIALATLIPWFGLILCGILLAKLDPLRSSLPGDQIWIMVGWLPSLLYAVILYGLKVLVLLGKAWRSGRRRLSQ